MITYPLASLIFGSIKGTGFSFGSLYLALFTGNPGLTGTLAAEVASGTGYSRLPISLGDPANGVVSNTNLLDYGTAGSSWGTVTHAGLVNQSSSGTLLVVDALSAAKEIQAGDAVSIGVGDVTFTLA